MVPGLGDGGANGGGGGSGGGGGGVSEILEVPLGDLSLLINPPVGGYGSRTHNLKIDLKEV